VTDSRMKGRVKGLFGGTAPDNETMEQVPVVAPGMPPQMASAGHAGPPPNMGNGMADPDAQRQALQVLVLAQRTADDHVATARQQADKIRADARGTAEQIVRDAQAHADGARREASKALSDARASAEQIVRDAQANADGVRREAEKTLNDAHARAEEIDKDAQAAADELDREAQQRYDEVVGSLAAKRAALQQQIEALVQFDRDYRARLRTFMQSQLHALGLDEPPPNLDVQHAATMAATVTSAASTSSQE